MDVHVTGIFILKTKGGRELYKLSLVTVRCSPATVDGFCALEETMLDLPQAIVLPRWMSEPGLISLFLMITTFY